MTKLIVTFQQAGFHHWPNPPKEVLTGGYLKNLHRHNFHIRCELEVRGLDREVELHELLCVCKQQLRIGYKDSMYDQTALNFANQSCETIANYLCHRLICCYPGERQVAVEVWEDGECGARVELCNGAV